MQVSILVGRRSAATRPRVALSALLLVAVLGAAAPAARAAEDEAASSGDASALGETAASGDVPMLLAQADGSRPWTARLDPVVVTATRTDEPLSDVPQTVTVITREDIEESKVETVGDLLRAVAGVEVLQSGGRGTNTSVSIRGSESDEVLVLIDGVQVNSVTLGAFDFANLTPEGFDRVEVLRGGGGSLYGSEAVGGVINMITRRGHTPASGAISLAGGNGSTDRETGTFSAATDLFRIAGSATHIYTGGFGEPVPIDESGTAKDNNDDYEATTFSLRADWTPTDTSSLYAILHYVGSDVGLQNASNFLGVLDPNARLRDDFYFAKLGWEDAPIDGLTYRLSGAYVRDDQRFDDPPDPGNSADTRSTIPSELVQGDAQANYAWRWSISTLGFQYTRKSAHVRSFSSFSDPPETTFDVSRNDYGVYGQEQIRLFDDRLIVLGSVRYDHDQQFGDVVSPTGAIAMRLPFEPWPPYLTDVRLRASYAEGFRAPTFNELFFPGFGNPDLDPERSAEWNVGIDLQWFDGRVLLSSTYFDRRVTDDIVTVLVDPETFEFAPVNLGRVDAQGVEAILQADLGYGFAFGGAYTYLGLSSAGGAGSVTRRPNNQMSAFVRYNTPRVFADDDAFQVRVDVFYVGDRPDFDPVTGDVVTNPAYTRVDLATAYLLPWRLRDVTFSLWGQVSNLFDRKYEEVLGFPSLPINALAGIRAAF